MGFQEISKNNRCSSTIQVRMWSSKRIKIPQFLVMIREGHVIIRYTLCLDSCDLYSHETIFCSPFVYIFSQIAMFLAKLRAISWPSDWATRLYHSSSTSTPPKTHRCLWTSWALPQIVDQQKTCLSRKMVRNASKRLFFTSVHLFLAFLHLFTFTNQREDLVHWLSNDIYWFLLLVRLSTPCTHLHPNLAEVCQ